MVSPPPRFGTPRHPDRATLGHQVGAIAARLGAPLMPWQQLVADVVMEIDPVTGGLVYGEVDLTVPRQSGKSTLVWAMLVHRLLVHARGRGVQRGMYLTKDLIAARGKLRDDFAAMLRRETGSFTEVPTGRVGPTRPTEWRLSLNNNDTRLVFGGGGLVKVVAPTETAGHGDVLDLVVVDEAFDHETDAVEVGVRPTQATRADAQMWVVSTAGHGRSSYLWRKVVAGRRAVQRGEGATVAFFEWSADEVDDPGDPETWRACSPALGVTIEERFLAEEWDRAQRGGLEGVDLFRRSWLNQWPVTPVLEGEEVEGVFAAGEWAACHDESVGPGDPVAVAFDVTPDQAHASVAVAGVADEAGRVGLEVVEHGHGTGWVIDRVLSLKERHEVCVVVCDRSSPAAALLQRAERAGISVVTASSAEHAQACGALAADVTDGRVRVRSQPVLEAAVAGAQTRPVTDAWVWSRTRSSVDVSPLVAVTLARWGLLRAPDDAPVPAADFYVL